MTMAGCIDGDSWPRGCVSVTDSAKIVLINTSMSSPRGTVGVSGVMVHGKSTQATLHQCKIAVSGPGVSVHAYTSCTLCDCEITGGERGIVVAGFEAKAHASDCVMLKQSHDSVVVHGEGSLEMQKCTVRHSYCAALVHGEGSSAELNQCLLTRCQFGVVAVAGASCKIETGRVDHNKWGGVCVHSGANVQLSGLTVAHTERGCGCVVCDEGSSIDAASCSFSDNSLHRACALRGATLLALECSAKMNGLSHAIQKLTPPYLRPDFHPYTLSDSNDVQGHS